MSLVIPNTFSNGTTADAPSVNANFTAIANYVNDDVALNGANADITSLSGLTTPLSIGQGGTGATVLQQYYIITSTGSALAGINPGSSSGIPLVNRGPGNYPNFVASGVSAGTYTNADITVSAGGLITAASNGALNWPVLLASGNLATGSTTMLQLDLASYTGYNRFEVHLDNVTSSSNDVGVQFSTNGGSSYLNTNYSYLAGSESTTYSGSGVNPASVINLDNTSSSSLEHVTVTLWGINGAGAAYVDGKTSIPATHVKSFGRGGHAATGVNAVQFIQASSNNTGGTYSLWGWV